MNFDRQIISLLKIFFGYEYGEGCEEGVSACHEFEGDRSDIWADVGFSGEQYGRPHTNSVDLAEAFATVSFGNRVGTWFDVPS